MFLIFLGVVIGLVVDYLIANEFYKVAAAKGFDEKKYLWICFFLGTVGYLLVIALPNKRTNQNHTIPANNPLPNMGRM